MSTGWPETEKLLYLEYEIQQDKPGLLGAVTTLMGMLDFNILTVSGTGVRKRGFLLRTMSEAKVNALKSALDQVEAIRVIALRSPTPLDRIALRHGRRLDPTAENPPTYRFVREELGVLVDFLGDTLLERKNLIIGVRGMPRVGKTEAAIAACVYANKKWIMLSSTLIRQIVRTTLMIDEAQNSIFLIDGITSTSRGNPKHWKLLADVMEIQTPKIIEHPDIFLRDGKLKVKFDLMIEIRNYNEDVIRTEEVNSSFSSFDLS